MRPERSGSDLGDRLRAVRESRGLSRAAVARSAGMPTRELAAYERRRQEPSAADLRALAGSCGVHVEELLGSHPVVDEQHSFDAQLDEFFMPAETIPPLDEFDRDASGSILASPGGQEQRPTSTVGTAHRRRAIACAVVLALAWVVGLLSTGEGRRRARSGAPSGVSTLREAIRL
jgi:transcriptional regulator with XRE-family HTH domain